MTTVRFLGTDFTPVSDVDGIVAAMKIPMKSVSRTMGRLGMLRVTVIMTVASAFMSLAVAWLLYQFMPVPEPAVYLRMAFIIPFFVTPGFSYLTAFSLRDSARARKAAVEMARCDPLTGVANRRAFFEIDGLQRAANEAAGRDRALLFLDIDHFKAVNDAFGHEAGDAVLVDLAKQLGDITRKGDVVARFGGEEFVIITHNCDAADAEALAKRILLAVRSTPCEVASRSINYTVSIGVAVGGPGVTTTQLLSEADTQLYAAKSGGRDTVRLSRMSPILTVVTDVAQNSSRAA